MRNALHRRLQALEAAEDNRRRAQGPQLSSDARAQALAELCAWHAEVCSRGCSMPGLELLDSAAYLALVVPRLGGLSRG